MAETDNETLNEENEETMSASEETNDENTDMTEEQIKESEEYLTESNDKQKDSTYSGELKNESGIDDATDFLIAAETASYGDNDQWYGHKTVQEGNVTFLDRNGEEMSTIDFDTYDQRNFLFANIDMIDHIANKNNRLDTMTADDAAKYGREEDIVTNSDGNEAVYLEEFGGSVCEGERQKWSDSNGSNPIGALGNFLSTSTDDVLASAVHYEGVLGTFDYDTSDWELATKTVEDENGNSAEIPILRYIGTEINGENINIPTGLKSLDYSFEGTDVYSVPVIPDSVESAHCAFMDCDSLAGFCDSYTTGEALGAGGQAIMSDTMEDASDMFYGCDKMNETYALAGENLLDARGMYNGTKLSSDWEDVGDVVGGIYSLAGGFVGSIVSTVYGIANSLTGDALPDWEYGEVQKVQDNSPSLINEDTNEGMYDNSGSSSVHPNTGDRVDDTTGDVAEEDLQDSPVSEDVYNAVHENATDENLHTNAGSVEITDAYILQGSTDGLYHYKDADGNDCTATEAQECLDNVDREKGTGLMSLVDTAGSLVTEYGISSFALGLVTDSKLLKVAGSIGIVAVGQITNIFPNTLSSMLDWIGEKLETVSPEASEIIGKISGFLGSGGDKENGQNEDYDRQQEMIDEAKEKDKNIKDTENDKTVVALTDTLNAQLFDTSYGLGKINQWGENSYKSTTDDLTLQMSENGKNLSTSGAVYSLYKAYSQNDMTVFNEQKETADTLINGNDASTGLIGKYDKWASSNEDGQLTETQKESAFKDFNAIYSGMQAYSEGVIENLPEEDKEKGELVVSTIMESTMPEYIQMMQDMDAKYDILTDEQREQLDSYDIPGVAKFSEYGYANAGIEDSAEETETAEEQTDNAATDVSDETSSEESDETEETHRGVASGQNKAETSRGEEAEDIFEDVMDEAEEEEKETAGVYTAVDPSLAI